MQVYGFYICTLRLPVISVMIIGVMQLSYNEIAVPHIEATLKVFCLLSV